MNKKIIDSNIAALIIFATSIVAIVAIFDWNVLVNLYFSKLTPVEFFVISLLAVIICFLIFREIIMWYWKINRMVKLLEQIEENTRPISNENNSRG